MRRAEVNVVANLMGMYCAQMSIARLSGLPTVVALKFARCLVSGDRAAGRTPAAARADDS
jgi:hypothetical protein